MSKVMLRRPDTLFIVGATILVIGGIIFFHANWPPTHWPKVTFSSGDFGQELLFCAVVFGGIGLAYYTLSRLTRLQMKPFLGYIHFAISSAAILVGVFLNYWFSVTYKRIPGEDFWSAFARELGASLKGDIWAFWIFAAAQLVFLLNLSWALVKRFRPSPVR